MEQFQSNTKSITIRKMKKYKGSKKLKNIMEREIGGNSRMAEQLCKKTKRKAKRDATIEKQRQKKTTDRKK
jgi:hypothetical protein